MPTRARRRCTRCRRVLGADGRCTAECRARRKAAGNRARAEEQRQAYGTEHRELFRKPVLARDPVCVVCGVAPSTVADHFPLSRRQLVAAGLDPNDPQHGRGVCKTCHDRETAKNQPGGWNRR